MLSRGSFKVDGIQITDNLEFSIDPCTPTVLNGAWTVLTNPHITSTNQRTSTFVSRLQIRGGGARKLRVRYESGGTISNAWVDFEGLEQASASDEGLAIWFVSQEIVIVDARLCVINDNVRFSLHILDSESDVSDCSFVLQKFEFHFEIGSNYRNPKLEYHSHAHAGKAPELCKGIGIEIGALYKPLPLDACVLHVDRFSTEALKKSYRNDPNVPLDQIRQVQVAWNDGSYPFFDDNAFDFVVNSHVLEHVFNPGRQIQEWLRIIKPGGILYMIVPDKNYCFDRRRSVTSVDHLMKEYFDDVNKITLDHYQDFMINTNGEDGHYRDISEKSIMACYQAQSSIHVHTFTPDSLQLFINELLPHLNAEVIHYDFKGLNMHCAIRKN